MADRYKIQNVDASGNKRDEVVIGDDIRVSTDPSGSMTIEVIQNSKVNNHRQSRWHYLGL